MHVDHNEFSSIPSTIGNLVKLSHLVISHNPISGDLPGEFWRLQELRTIIMQHCGLTGSLAGIGALSWLENLVANDNELTGGIPPNEVSLLTELR
ncbi:hypothetical protein HDU78_011361, partial [Chytriomyces hyalinus]